MKVLLCVAVLAAMLVSSGCASMALGPVPSFITVDQRGPVAVGPATSMGSKVGRAKAEGILIVSFGDASIAAAAKAGGITKIHHVDNQTMNILGAYARYETVVYGD